MRISVMPSSLRSSAVSSPSTSASMAFSRNASSYCSSPRPLSQSAISMTSSGSRQLGKEHCGVLQIGGTEALGEPAIHGREQVVRLGPPALFAPQPSKARCRAQLGVAKINEYAVAHVLGDKSSEAGDRVGHAAMIGTDNLAQILGVVTRRQWRRAHQIAEHHGQLPPLGLASDRRGGRVGAGGVSVLPKAAIASSSRRRCPPSTAPRSLRSSAVSFGNASQSISFSRNAGSYRSRPRLCSYVP